MAAAASNPEAAPAKPAAKVETKPKETVTAAPTKLAQPAKSEPAAMTAKGVTESKVADAP